MIGSTLLGYAQLSVDTTSNLDSIMVLAKAVTPLGRPAKISRKDWQAGKLSSRPEEALLYLPGVHIRQRGPGQVATLQYRGLQGARIAQTWQGIPVTNPQIGTGDANELTLALVDQIELGSPENIGNAAAISSSQTAGGLSSLSARYANGNGLFLNGQWKGLRVLFQQDAHNFPHSYSGREFGPEDPEVKTGIQGASFTKTLGGGWSSSSYFLRSDRIIEEVNDGFERFNYESRLKTTTARQLFTWVSDTSVRFDLGFLFDRQKYSIAARTPSVGSTFQMLAQSQFQIFRDVKFTTDNRILVSTNSEYTRKVLLPETRSLVTYSKQKEGLKFNLTSGFHARLKSGVILFGNASLSKEFSKIVRVQMNVKKIGRIPSLDDQLWEQGGIEDLKAENGWEFSSSSQGKIGAVILTPLVFVRQYSNYILWLPRGNFWSPNNIPAVNNIGVGLDLSTRLGSKDHFVKMLGSFNYSQLRLAEDQILPNRVILKADTNLPFAPSVTGSATLDYVYRKWSVLAQGRYTGKQLTAYNGLSESDEHAVLRTAISHQFEALAITVSCENVTNTIIPNDFGLFSPLRRFELTLNYTPKKRL